MPGKIPTIALHPSAVIRNLPRPIGFKLVSLSVALNGNAVRLFVPDETNGDFAKTVQPRWASFPKTKTEEGYSAIVVVSGSQGSDEVHLSGLTARFPAIEMLPGNEFLVVAPRCWRFDDGTHELNAKVYDSSGTLKRVFLLGDGIEHVQADVRGNIWVGYFDEGVYGNFGWQEAGGPFGAAGLSCFSDNGEKLWDFHPPQGFHDICDCEALNASRQGVWAYYYTGYPFVSVDSQWQVRCWETESDGGSTFAVAEQQLLLYGGYRDDRNVCKLFRIDDEHTELAAHVSLALPTEVDLSKSTVIGRDADLHVFSGNDWYRFSIVSLG